MQKIGAEKTRSVQQMTAQLATTERQGWEQRHRLLRRWAGVSKSAPRAVSIRNQIPAQIVRHSTILASQWFFFAPNKSTMKTCC